MLLAALGVVAFLFVMFSVRTTHTRYEMHGPGMMQPATPMKAPAFGGPRVIQSPGNNRMEMVGPNGERIEIQIPDAARPE